MTSSTTTSTAPSTALPTRLLDGAGLVITKVEPNIITLPDGRKFQVTIRIKEEDGWKEVDLSKLSTLGEFDIQDLMNRCQTIYAAMGPANATSFSLFFKGTPGESSFTGPTLGRFIDYFKNTDPQAQVLKIEYKMVGSDKPQVMELKDFKLTKMVEGVLNEQTREIAKYANTVFAYREALVKDTRKDFPSTSKRQNSPTNEQQLQEIERVLNVTNNSGTENRCATLSIADILLKRHGGILRDAAKAYSIPISPKDGESSQITLSNGLIELAARTIETEDQFSRADTSGNPNAYFSSIIGCLRDAGQNIKDETKRKEVAQQYANHIREPGRMLDVSVLDALSMHGIPFIALVPTQARDALILGSVSGELISFDAADHSIDTYDLTNICFVVRDGLHYRAIIMNDNPAQDTKLRSILRNDLNKQLQQLDIEVKKVVPSLTDAEIPTNPSYNHIYPKVVDLMDRYSFDAKPLIIKMLTDNKRIFDEAQLQRANEDAFIEASVRAFLGPKVEIT